MRILSAHVTHARRLRDFGQIEAIVSLLVKSDGRPVPHEVRVLTAVPISADPGNSLRNRLLDSAQRLHCMRAAHPEAAGHPFRAA